MESVIEQISSAGRYLVNDVRFREACAREIISEVATLIDGLERRQNIGEMRRVLEFAMNKGVCIAARNIDAATKP